MLKLVPTLALIGLAPCSPVAAALESPDVYAEEVFSGSTGTKPAVPMAICVPPELQYIPDFIRNMDGTIIGINYTIVEYVC